MKKIYNLRKNQVSIMKFVQATLVLLLFYQNSMAQTVTIPAANTNSSSNYQPLGSFFGYQRSVMIYTAAELGLVSGTKINLIGFYYNSFQTPNGSAPYVIRMVNTTSSTLIPSTYASEIAGATTVLNGTDTGIPVSFPASGWFTNSLTTPFVYTGGNIKIMIETNAGGTGNESNTDKLFRWSTGISQTWQSDFGGSLGLGTVLTLRPNIQLSYVLPPANDACSNALVANAFPYTNVQTLAENATNNAGFLGCANPMNDGVWYKFVGTGANMRVAITGVDATFDPQLDIYSGVCGNLACVAAADLNASGGNETLTIPTVLGANYFVNIGHWQENVDAPEGNFTIRISDLTPNEIAFETLSIYGYENQTATIKVSRISGTNGVVTVDYVPNDGNAYNGVDYTFAGGTLTWADGDTTPKTFQVQLLPDALIDPLETFTFLLLNPTNSTIVFGNSATVTIIDANAIPANDACANALNAVTLPYSHVQTLGESATNNTGSIACGLGGTNDGLWYKFTGNGANITASLTNVVADFDPELAIYSGSCAATSCINYTDINDIGEGETLAIPTVLGTVYYLNIGNKGFDIDAPEGNFKIDITTTALANESFDFKNLKVYPNPVTNILNIENNEKITKVTIINMLGQELITKNFDDFKTEVDFSDIKTGHYFAKVYSNNSEQTIKIIKK